MDSNSGNKSTLKGQNLSIISNKSRGVLQEKEWNSTSLSLTNSQITGNSAAYYLDASYVYYDDEANSLNITGGSVTATAKDGEHSMSMQALQILPLIICKRQCHKSVDG